MLENEVLRNLTNIWNYQGRNNPDDFKKFSGKEWLALNLYSLSNRLKSTEESITVSLRSLKDKHKLDYIKDNRTYFYSLSPAETTEETKAETQDEVFAVPESKTQSVCLVDNVYAGLSAQDKWKRWQINCNMEWQAGLIDNLDENGVPDGRKCSTTHRFKNIQQYFKFRRTHDADPYVLKKMKTAMDDWLCPNVYWEGMSLSPAEWEKCGIKVS